VFERIGRFVRKVISGLETPPDSFDEPRPQRANPDPPRNEWFGRVRARSQAATTKAATKAAKNEAKKLDALDKAEPNPALSAAGEKAVDDLFAKLETR
jgi:hypothetical protein